MPASLYVGLTCVGGAETTTVDVWHLLPEHGMFDDVSAFLAHYSCVSLPPLLATWIDKTTRLSDVQPRLLRALEHRLPAPLTRLVWAYADGSQGLLVQVVGVSRFDRPTSDDLSDDYFEDGLRLRAVEDDSDSETAAVGRVTARGVFRFRTEVRTTLPPKSCPITKFALESQVGGGRMIKHVFNDSSGSVAGRLSLTF